MSERVGKYFDNIIRFLQLHPIVENVVIERRIVTRSRGYFKATVNFLDRSQLHIRELIGDGLRKLDYAYHYQNSGGKLVFRYDNAPHQ